MMRDFIEAANESRAKGRCKKVYFSGAKPYIQNLYISSYNQKFTHQNSLMHAHVQKFMCYINDHFHHYVNITIAT